MHQEPRLVPGTAPSILRRLLLMLLVPAVGILMLGTLIDFSTPATPIRQAYDQALLASALALADHVALSPNGLPTLALPSEAIAVLRADTADSIYFKVTAPDGTYIAGDRDLPELPRASAKTLHGYARYRNQPIRL